MLSALQDFQNKLGIWISQEMGRELEELDTLQLTLSSVMGAGYKYEPIFVFRKESK